MLTGNIGKLERGTEFCSTILAFSTDTFTGKVLCGGDVPSRIIRGVIERVVYVSFTGDALRIFAHCSI